jgi:hypothetical protein
MRIMDTMENLNFKLPNIKPRNMVAKDLRSPKYRMRVVENKRKKEVKHKGNCDELYTRIR